MYSALNILLDMQIISAHFLHKFLLQLYGTGSPGNSLEDDGKLAGEIERL